MFFVCVVGCPGMSGHVDHDKSARLFGRQVQDASRW